MTESPLETEIGSTLTKFFNAMIEGELQSASALTGLPVETIKERALQMVHNSTDKDIYECIHFIRDAYLVTKPRLGGFDAEDSDS